jgi:hypothetical protein
MNTPTVRRGAEHRSVSFRRAVRIQLRLLWLSRRPAVLLAAILALLLLARELAPSVGIIRPLTFLLLMHFTGPTWAFAVWAGEPPSGRDY